MTDRTWSLDARDGELSVHTGVTGRAARMGHRLVIVARQWQAQVTFTCDAPTAVELTVGVDSLAVVHGEGGVKALSESEKVLARSKALESFDPDRFPEIRFVTDAVAGTDAGYRLTGALQIRGTTHTQVVDVETHDVGDAWRLSSATAIRQSDFGIRPHSMLMGSMRVTDSVTVVFHASRSKLA